ncbi:hypothetical protein LWI29_006895 [Acer saccharum]|uniref:Uncharacterized protein n=1 Tax=Acer saccharum TaxID=4024 RepID=A0AA39VYW2_ACESA|nr:hypothetical protein LWI29_006895 [Acer saccharum]
MSIQEFYSAMTNLWDQLVLTESVELWAFTPYITCRDEQWLVQFLMALRDDFEGLRRSRTDTSANTGTSLSITSDAPSLPAATQAPTETMDPLRYPQRDHPTLYRTIVDSLVYLTITRLNIAYVVHIVSQFVASHTSVHWAAVLRILRYL